MFIKNAANSIRNAGLRLFYPAQFWLHKKQMGEGIRYFDGYDHLSLAGHLEELLVDSNSAIETVKAQEKIRKSICDYNYAERIISILDEFRKMEMTWK